jgi:hypothetical protein
MSTGRPRLLELVANTAFAFAAAFAEARGYLTDGVLYSIAIVAVTVAAPWAVTIVFRLDREGQFDQLRLTGVSDGILLAAVACGVVAPKLAIGGAVLAAGALSGAIDARQSILAALICGLSIFVSTAAVSSLVSMRGFAMVGLPGSVLVIGATAWIAGAGFDGPAWYLWLTSPRVWPWLLAAECGLILLSVPTLRTIGRRSVAVVRASPWFRRIGMTIPLWLPPQIARGVVQAQAGALFSLVVAAVAIAIVWLGFSSSVDPIASAKVASGIAYFPLVLGVLSGLTQGQFEAQSGRLDMVRLAPVSPAVGAILTILGYCLPFVLASMLAGVAVLILYGDVPWFAVFALLAAATLASAAFAEGWGWRGKKHFMGAVTALPFCLVAVEQEAAGAIVTWLLLGWPPLAVAVATFKNPDKPVVPGWVAAVAVSGAAYVLLHATFVMPVRLQFEGVALAAGLLVAASLVEVKHRAIGPYLVFLAIAGVGVTLIVMRSYPWLPGLAVILTAAVGWWAGCRIERRWPSATSMFMRVGLAYATFAGGLLLSSVLPGRDRLTPAAFAGAYYLTVTAWVIVVTVLSDVAGIVLHRQSVRKVTS